MGVGELAEELLDLDRADVLAAPEQIVEVVARTGELRLLGRPLGEPVAAELEQLGLDERHRGEHLAVRRLRLPEACDRILAGGVDRVVEVRVDEDVACTPHQIVPSDERLDRDLGPLSEPAREPLETGKIGE